MPSLGGGYRRVAAGAALHEGGEQRRRVVRVRRDRIELAEIRRERVEQRLRGLEHARRRRQPGLRGGPQRPLEPVVVGERRRESAEVVDDRHHRPRHRLEVAHERLGVLGERVEAVVEALLLVEERREDVDRLSQGPALLGRRAEEALRVHDQLAELVSALVERGVDHARVAHEVVERVLPRVQPLEELCSLLAERRELTERVVEVLADPPRYLLGELCGEALERSPRRAVVDRQEIVDGDGPRDGRRGEAPAVRQLRACG